MNTYFSIAFKTLRKQLGCNEADFATLLDIDESEVMLIENYELLPDADTICKFSDLEVADMSLLERMY